MSAEHQQILAGIAALEAQRGLLGDAVVDASIAALRSKLLELSSASAADPAQTLRQVSIVFLDVVGSTALSQHLDAEDIHAVMDGALTRCTTVVLAHHGKVLQYAGDSLLAAFGVTEAKEDDAERAVRCGLALLAEGRALSAEVQAAHDHTGFDVRVGIHTGGVLLGGGVDSDGTIRGIAVNIAARMEQTAPAGALRVSHDTYAQVRGIFDVEPQEPMTVKGVDTPIQSYLVLRAKPRAFRIATRGIEGVPTRMIGRDAELEALQATFRQLFAERKLVAVTVVADAGIGKSRLLYEFEAWSETRPETFFLFRGRATPQTGAQVFGLLRDIIAWRFQINDDDSIEVARGKIEKGIVPLFVHDDGPDLAEGHAHLLGHLIGIEWKASRHLRDILDDAKQIRNRAFHAAAQMFRRISASDGSPVILQIEDLHWADGESLDFLNYLAEVNRDVPLWILAFTRPTLFEWRTDWRGTAAVHQRIDLAPLDKRASRDLANELLRKLPEVPAVLRELLTSNSEGNPFYMEELVKMLIDRGGIRTGETWTVNAEQLLVTQVPATLTGVLQARLDGLPAPEKYALQQASVIGSVFWDQALAAVEAQAIEQLPALVQRELVLPRADVPLDGVREYAFRHQVLHQVTYDTVLKRHKRAGHAKVAQWLAGLTERGSLRAGDFLGLAAEHFERAGDDANAIEFHVRAAEQAALRLAHERVLAHVDRALRLLGDGPLAQATHAELRWRLLIVREQSLALQARRDEQAADLDGLAQLADALDDDRRRADVALRRSSQAMRMGDWAATGDAAHRGLDCATRAGAHSLRLKLLRLQAVSRVYRGDIEGGRALAQQALAEVRSLKVPGVESRLLGVLAIASGMQGDLVSGLELERQATEIDRECGDRIGEAIGLVNLGVRWLSLGNLVLARRELEVGLQLLRSNGHRAVEGHVLGNLSELATWQGEETRALALARSALEIAVATQARDSEVFAGLTLGRAELSVGRLDGARLAFEQAQARALEIDSRTQHDASVGLARVALAGGHLVEALGALRSVMDYAEAGGTLDGTNDARLIELTCYQALNRAGDPRAADWLERAYTAVMAQADTINDAALRQGFLQNIPHHREIVAVWAQSAMGPTDPG